MTDYQDALVLENLDLVNWVIRTRISIPNRPLLTYDDFYAIGCEAICRAALKYQPDMGAFAPFACRYIYNAIVDHCRAMNYRLERNVEISEDENASLLDMLTCTSVDFDETVTDATAMSALAACKEKYNGVARKGVEAIELKLKGYEATEIAKHYDTRARATAIVIQDFCESLGIPLLVVGHTAWSSHVELFSYSDFDTYDKNNRYRLMDMSARDCNRDGAALRFVAEKLSKQTSEVKILMIICDGQPNDDGYSGSAAEADLRGIKLEYARKGVKIYAAAIGEDRPRIERIYGDGYLDITNLQELPVMLTNLIVRSLPH